MKSQKFFFTIVAVVVVVFFFFFFGFVKPRFQSAVREVKEVQVASVVNGVPEVVGTVNVQGVDAVSNGVVEVNAVEVERVVGQVNIIG